MKQGEIVLDLSVLCGGRGREVESVLVRVTVLQSLLSLGRTQCAYTMKWQSMRETGARLMIR